MDVTGLPAVIVCKALRASFGMEIAPTLSYNRVVAPTTRSTSVVLSPGRIIDTDLTRHYDNTTETETVVHSCYCILAPDKTITRQHDRYIAKNPTNNCSWKKHANYSGVF